jgi:ketosteroid isomerase-like protein
MTLKEIEKKLAAAEEALKALEKRVRATEDVEKIKQLQQHYVSGLMRANWDEVLDCFAEDAFFDPGGQPVKGIKEISNVFKNVLSEWHCGQEGDFLVHPEISVNGDTARGHWLMYMMYYLPRSHQSLFWVNGFYDMEYRRVNGEWKINSLNWQLYTLPPGGTPPRELFK